MNETNWLPGILVGLAGITLGVIVLFMTRKKGPAAVVDTALRDLELRVSFLLDQLRSLEAEKHQFSAEAFAAEKTRLETEAASAMKARDEHQKKAAAKAAKSGAPKQQQVAQPEAAPAGFFARNQQLKGAVWGGGIVVFVMGIFLVLQSQQKDRGENEGMTGANPNERAAMGQQGAARLEDDPMFKQAYDRAKANPGDAEASAFVAHELIRLQRFDEAEELTRKALAANPFHVESRVHNEVIRATKGQFREAIEALGEISKAYPESHEALLFRGALAMEVGDSKVALESFEQFAKQTPPDQQPPQLQQTIAMLKQRVPPTAKQ